MATGTPVPVALADLTWPEAAARRRPGLVLAVPLGSTEQHGPHLPLSTDADIASALCDGLADALHDVVVAPPVPYGSSGEHAGFAGTLSIGAEATELVLVELCRSACESFDRIVLVCAHGGNAEALERAVARLRGEGREILAWSPRFGGDAHAGWVETSIMLALDAARVRAHEEVTGNTGSLDELLPVLRARGVRAASASGVLGDPARASVAEGRRLLADAVADLAARVTAWRS